MNENEGASNKSSGGKPVPFLALSRVSFRRMKVQIKSETHEMLGRYVAFYQQSAVAVKPDDSELIDSALQSAFLQDVGFQAFLKNGGSARVGTRAAVGSGGGAKAGSAAKVGEATGTGQEP